jgi:galactokinase
MSIEHRVIQAFKDRYDTTPSFLARAPGRVNLIGEHTDYNLGFVLPLAIDRAVYIAFQPRTDGCVRLYSLDFSEEIEFSFQDFNKGDAGWAEYIKGSAWAMIQQGHTPGGLDGVMVGDVPVGAGLSSSAAVEMAIISALAASGGLELEAVTRAKLGQMAENQWIGLNCGIMDQMISAGGLKGHGLLIDCRNLKTKAIPLPDSAKVMILDTGTRRGLKDSEYNERRSRCETAARILGVESLRDVSPEMFKARQHELDDITRRRAGHVIYENQRTLKTAGALTDGDSVQAGRLMNESHQSLRDDYQVSSPAWTPCNPAPWISRAYTARA